MSAGMIPKRPSMWNSVFQDPTNESYWHMTQGQTPGQHPKDQYVIVVQKVANGYTVTCNDQMWIAKDTDELKDLFVTAIVADKLGG